MAKGLRGRPLKTIRKFNNKLYVRVFTGRNEALAEKIKQNIKNRGDYALIVRNPPHYQVWSRKNKRQ